MCPESYNTELPANEFTILNLVVVGGTLLEIIVFSPELSVESNPFAVATILYCACGAAVRKFISYVPVPLSVTLETLPDCIMYKVLKPFKVHQQRAGYRPAPVDVCRLSTLSVLILDNTPY